MKIYEGKQIPKLQKQQCSLVLAELWTGKVLTLDGKRYDARVQEPHILIFDTIKDAENFAEKKINEFPNIECHIYDSEANHIKRMFKPDHKKPALKQKQEWWKFWRWKF